MKGTIPHRLYGTWNKCLPRLFRIRTRKKFHSRRFFVVVFYLIDEGGKIFEFSRSPSWLAPKQLTAVVKRQIEIATRGRRSRYVTQRSSLSESYGIGPKVFTTGIQSLPRLARHRSLFVAAGSDHKIRSRDYWREYLSFLHTMLTTKSAGRRAE